MKIIFESKNKHIIRMRDVEVGQVFKTEDDKVLMRVRNDFDKSFMVVNLQTAACWNPSDEILNNKVTLVDAEMKIKERS